MGWQDIQLHAGGCQNDRLTQGKAQKGTAVGEGEVRRGHFREVQGVFRMPQPQKNGREYGQATELCISSEGAETRSLDVEEGAGCLAEGKGGKDRGWSLAGEGETVVGGEGPGEACVVMRSKEEGKLVLKHSNVSKDIQSQNKKEFLTTIGEFKSRIDVLSPGRSRLLSPTASRLMSPNTRSKIFLTMTR